jgi:hypothetical protein
MSERENSYQKNIGRTSYTQTKLEKSFEKDLAIFSMYLAKDSDIVILLEKSSIEFLKSRKDFGLPVCEQNTFEEFSSHKHRKYQDFCPWGFSPKSVSFFQNFVKQWQNPKDVLALAEETSRLQSKVFSVEMAAKWGFQSFVVRSWADIEKLNLDCKHVAKPSHDSSGKDFVWFSRQEEIPRKWFDAFFEKGMAVIVEPWLDRKLDISFNFERRGKEVIALGFLPFLCDGDGKFLGTFVQKPWTRESREIYSYFEKRQEGFWLATKEKLRAFLEKELVASVYQGPLGVDAFVYQSKNAQLELKVISEINFRYTMGRLALTLKDHVHASSHAFLWITNRYTLEKKGINLADFPQTAEIKETRMGRKILRGQIALNDPKTAETFLALLLIDPDEERLHAIRNKTESLPPA